MTKNTKTYTATATRDGRWWLIEVEELDARGQARTLSEIDEVAREVIGLWLDIDPEGINVAVNVMMPADASELWESANQKELDARAAVKEAAQLRRDAVAKLVGSGMTQREAGQVLGLSPQRIGQLAHAK